MLIGIEGIADVAPAKYDEDMNTELVLPAGYGPGTEVMTIGGSVVSVEVLSQAVQIVLYSVVHNVVVEPEDETAAAEEPDAGTLG